MPIINKEAIALRILNRKDLVMEIEKLGFNKFQLEIIRSLIKRGSTCIISMDQ